MPPRAAHGPSPSARSEDWVVLAAVLAVVAAPSLITLFIAGGIAAYAWGMNKAAILRRRLRAKGFDWVRLEDARYLCHVAHPDALRRLPPRQEVEGLPAYRPGDAQSLVDLAAMLERQRGAIRSRTAARQHANSAR